MSKLICKGYDGKEHHCSMRGQDGYCPSCMEKLINPDDDYKLKIVFRKAPSNMGVYKSDGSEHLIIDIPKGEQWKIDSNHEYIITLEW